MTRIIGGTLGGRTIATPRGPDTRPTTDRVREALFSRVEAIFDLAGARVLDLYAGSGALGLEAVSRGAEGVLLVEADRRAAGVIEANVAQLGLAGAARVRADRVERVLERGPGSGPESGSESGSGSGPEQEPFDLVFLDPPYPLGEADLTGVLELLVSHRWLGADALVVVERSSRSPEPTWPTGLVHLRSSSYGETAVHLAEPSPEP